MANVTTTFIDLATYDELERYLYGGDLATAYFVRETRKSTWFSQAPVSLAVAAGGQAGFNSDFSYQISRAGDYMMHAWLRCTIPAVTAGTTAEPLAWTSNLMHNLIEECSITFNDLVAARFDNYHLDFWTAFTVPAGKQNGYNNMIGNVGALTNFSLTTGTATLNLPLPLFFSRDSGVALPTAALPYNDMRITFKTRDWSELLLRQNAGVIANANTTGTHVTAAPVLQNVQLWANYAVVSNEERTRMGQNPRDILIEQVQSVTRQNFDSSADQRNSYDVRFSHAIKCFFFGVRNVSVTNLWSNYTTETPTGGVGGLTFNNALDPIINTSLVYENTNRLADMGSDYMSLVGPYFQPNAVIPSTTGYHMYSYSLDFMSLDPMGSTNFGKLTNVSVVCQASAGATASGSDFQFVLTAINHNIIRVSGGALGFPVL